MGQTNSGFISIVGSVSVSVAIPISGIVYDEAQLFFLGLSDLDRCRSSSSELAPLLALSSHIVCLVCW